MTISLSIASRRVCNGLEIRDLANDPFAENCSPDISTTTLLATGYRSLTLGDLLL